MGKVVTLSQVSLEKGANIETAVTGGERGWGDAEERPLGLRWMGTMHSSSGKIGLWLGVPRLKT